jgi:epoxide hydrolase-like predicted phosphatase
MIKAVLFDFGGVLTESGKKGFIAQTLAELYGVNPEQLQYGDLHHMLRRGRGDIGPFDEDAFFAELNRRYHTQVTKETFLEKVHSTFNPSQQVYDLASTLRSHGIRTGILSNVFNMNAQELRKQGWYDGFDPVILSCEEGYAKPEKHFYEIAIERLAVRPEEILFIDDQEKCMPPAEKFGIHTIIAVSPQQIVKDVKAVILAQNGLAV